MILRESVVVGLVVLAVWGGAAGVVEFVCLGRGVAGLAGVCRLTLVVNNWLICIAVVCSAIRYRGRGAPRRKQLISSWCLS